MPSSQSPTIITEDALLAAAAFVTNYVIPSAQRTYGDATSSGEDRNITMLARWIAKERPRAIHVRDMQRNVRLQGLCEAKGIHAACAALIDAGWLGRPTTDTAFQQRGTKAYPVSPRLMTALG
jgi:hypothetical protein